MSQNLREPNCGVSWSELHRYHASHIVIRTHSTLYLTTVGATNDALSDDSRHKLHCSVRRYSGQLMLLCPTIVGTTTGALSTDSRGNFQWCIRERTRSTSRKSTRMWLNGKWWWFVVILMVAWHIRSSIKWLLLFGSKIPRFPGRYRLVQMTKRFVFQELG